MISIKRKATKLAELCKKVKVMKINKKALIKELLEITEQASNTVRQLKQLPVEKLNVKKNAEAWSALECIEHLNLYGDFYLPEIQKQILASRHANAPVFKSGVIGNYFAGLMKVQNGKVKKMKSPKDKNPAGSSLTITTLDRFLKQQELLKSLLIQSENTDLTKTKTSISISKLIRLRLGDTFRFFTYHIERHVKQAQKSYE